jgi:hypothetical protein
LSATVEMFACGTALGDATPGPTTAWKRRQRSVSLGEISGVYACKSYELFKTKDTQSGKKAGKKDTQIGASTDPWRGQLDPYAALFCFKTSEDTRYSSVAAE